ncbi:MAG: hypothetical protein J4O06_16060 [Chloroflexi bacterium]|nr:hypothetical protein [Chloroflexota bacterium]
MGQRYGDMREVLIVMEQGITHADGAQPRVSEVLSSVNGLHRQVCGQQVHTAVVQVNDLNRHLRIEVNKIEGDSQKEHPNDDETLE